MTEDKGTIATIADWLAIVRKYLPHAHAQTRFSVIEWAGMVADTQVRWAARQTDQPSVEYVPGTRTTTCRNCGDEDANAVTVRDDIEQPDTLFSRADIYGVTPRQRFERCTALGLCNSRSSDGCGCYKVVDTLHYMRTKRDSMDEPTFNRYQVCHAADECTATSWRDCVCPTARGEAVRRHRDGE